ncbi:MAG: heme o synthase [Burkholderiales bacterium]
MSTTLASGSSEVGRLARSVLGIFKLRIGVMIMVTGLVGALVAPTASLGVGQWLVLAMSVLMASASAGAFNQYYEFESDARMGRTRNRAFVTGALRRRPLWLAVMAAMLAGAVAAAWQVLNPLAAIFVFLGAFFYGVVYTVWLKRRTWLNIVVGGLAGSFAVLAGAAAVDTQIGALPGLLAVTLFLWTPPHFWSLAIANEAEYAAAGVPMLPVVVGPGRAAQAVFASAVLLVVASLLPVAFGAGLVYLVCSVAGGAYFVYRAWQLTRSVNRGTAIASFLASIVQLSAVLVGASVDAWLR